MSENDPLPEEPGPHSLSDRLGTLLLNMVGFKEKKPLRQQREEFMSHLKAAGFWRGVTQMIACSNPWTGRAITGAGAIVGFTGTLYAGFEAASFGTITGNSFLSAVAMVGTIPLVGVGLLVGETTGFMLALAVTYTAFHATGKQAAKRRLEAIYSYPQGSALLGGRPVTKGYVKMLENSDLRECLAERTLIDDIFMGEPVGDPLEFHNLEHYNNNQYWIDKKGDEDLAGATPPGHPALPEVL